LFILPAPVRLDLVPSIARPGANATGIEVPPGLLSIADEVIE
jgi:hypothetical protein